nr:hypothetical protein Iba_chr09aCG10510 [Ipomoea batatas]GME03729.1 hypothetical protein Iba_scaffold1112CG0010 [Ipomoea batatas]
MSLNFFMSCRKNCYWVIWQSCTKNNGEFQSFVHRGDGEDC